eukprot:scaffold14435_cov55-Phaeocystis_antarctica.AAC.3
MYLTLDVSKLSGWLNADARCRVERRAYDAGRGVGWGGRAWAGGSARAACTARGAAAVKAEGARECAERTLNMSCMSVTLDVSKLSGWLNADARCRVGRRAYDVERGVGWRRERAWAGGSARAACTGRGPGCEGWGGAIGHAQSARRTCGSCP